MTLLDRPTVGTRAHVRAIEAGAEDICPDDRGGCGKTVKFLAQIPLRYRRRVVANIYWQGKWNRIEVWHLLCYVAQGMPYGKLPELKEQDYNDMRAILDQGVAPSSDEAIEMLKAVAQARRDPAYRPGA